MTEQQDSLGNYEDINSKNKCGEFLRWLFLPPFPSLGKEC
jgi:hypothetical protein